MARRHCVHHESAAGRFTLCRPVCAPPKEQLTSPEPRSESHGRRNIPPLAQNSRIGTRIAAAARHIAEKKIRAQRPGIHGRRPQRPLNGRHPAPPTFIASPMGEAMGGLSPLPALSAIRAAEVQPMGTCRHLLTRRTRTGPAGSLPADSHHETETDYSQFIG